MSKYAFKEIGLSSLGRFTNADGTFRLGEIQDFLTEVLAQGGNDDTLISLGSHQLAARVPVELEGGQ